MSWRKEWNIRARSGKSEGSKTTIIDKLLEIRGITTEEAKRTFLNPLEITLMHPNAFCDMQKAVERICRAIDNKEKILIYGDFDADGVTSTSLMLKTISYLGGVVDKYIPNRDTEGHGLNKNTVPSIIKEKQPRLIITVDNGISSVEEVEYIKSFKCVENGQFVQKTDIIITDHHEAPDKLPPAYAIINPKAMNALSEKLTPVQIEYLTSLAGVGVAFKLAQGILEKYNKLSYSSELLPLVAVGTIADLVPLIGENRYYVTKGIELIKEGKNPGIKKMLDEAGIKTDNLTSEQIAFSIAPRINASGRLDTVDAAINVLTLDNNVEIEPFVKLLDGYNQSRQVLCSEIFAQADEMWINSKSRDNAIVLYKENWHIGIIGIVASKFVEKYYKPTFIMTSSKDSEGNTLYRCSARGVKELNLYDIISNISDKLDGFGGHKLAGGFAFSAQKATFEEVKKALNETVDEMLNGQKLSPSLDVDMELSTEDIDVSLVEELSKLEPFGMDNPSPTFVINNLTLKQKKLMGASKEHLKLIVEGKDGAIDCVWWSRGDISLLAGDKIDIAFSPQLNTFRDVTTVQLVLKDVHSDALTDEEEPKQKIYDHRKKTDIYAQIDDYLKTSTHNTAVFVEDKAILQSLKPYVNICNNVIDRNSAKKSDVLMFFDYPADDDVLQTVMQTVAPDEIHYMKYNSLPNEENMLKVFSGMVKYSCNKLNGEFNLSRAASALGLTEAAVEVLLEMFEDAGMLRIRERADKAFIIEFLNAIEISGAFNTPKYAEFAELMNTINDYKNKFMTMDLLPISG